MAMRSHYLFEAVFCRRGVQGASEKGSVEPAVGCFRRHHMMPVAPLADVQALNDDLHACCAEDEQRRVGERTVTVAQTWAEDKREPGSNRSYAYCPLKRSIAAQCPLIASMPSHGCACAPIVTRCRCAWWVNA